MLEISEDQGSLIEISEAEKEVNFHLGLSFVTLGLTSAAAVYPPLTLISLPPVLYLYYECMKNAKTILFEHKQVGLALINITWFTGALFAGYHVGTSLLLFLYYVSEKLFIAAEDHGQKSLINVFALKQDFVWVLQDEVEVQLPIEELSVGDTIVVSTGETIPIDGMITSGHATIDQSMLTGESQPVERSMGDSCFASTVLLSGKIHIQVEKAGGETVAAQIGDILLRTADYRSSVQSRGKQIIDRWAFPTLGFSALALWPIGGEGALAILNAGFGCHMRFAAPIAVLNFLRMASQHGLLIKDGRSLELLSQVDTFVFDKTGTLTEEVPTIGAIHTCHGISENELLGYAAAAEHKQSHPIAQAIRKEALIRQLDVPAIQDAKYEIGYGLIVSLPTPTGEQWIRVGSRRFIEMEGISIPSHIQKAEERCHEEGYSLVYLAIDEQLAGVIELQPTIRPEAQRIIRELQEQNMQIVIISGDHEKPTKKLAQKLGIDHYFAETLPQNKGQLIADLQAKGHRVCFIGDGINDSIAMKKAHVAISLRGASSIATDTAHVILMDGTLNQVVYLLNLSKQLDSNLKTSEIISIIPGAICVGGVFFLNFGIISAIVLYNVGLLVSVSNALLPFVKEKAKDFSFTKQLTAQPST